MQTTTIQSASLHFREGNSDKVYHAAIEPKGEGYIVTFAYGRRGNTLTRSQSCGQLQNSAQEFVTPMPSNRKANVTPLAGVALIKETCRRIRVARSYWDAQNNRACRGEREKALALYESQSDQ